MFAKKAKTGRLIISGIACAVDPTGIAIAAAALDTAIHASDEWFKKHPGLDDLAKDIQTAFDTEIAKPTYNKPEGIRLLLPQMLEASFPKDTTFAALHLKPDLILQHMQSQLSDQEHCLPQNKDVFAKVLAPLINMACNDPRIIPVIQPALIRQQGDNHKELMEAIQKKAAGQTSEISLGDLVLLAGKFGRNDITDRAELEDFLTKKAKEYRALKSEVDAISEDMKRLANLKAAAQDAIARVDLDEVENLLSRVQTAELEEAAKTAELRADNALLRGDVNKAFLLLSTAADSFEAVDPLEPARRRILGYNQILKDNGRRYGGEGLIKSAAMVSQVVTDDLRSANEHLWAAGQNTLAIAYQDQGTRTDGSKGAELLARAVAAYRAALAVYSRDEFPEDWALTQNNLGNSLQNQGTRTIGDEGAELLAQAVIVYRNALEVRTQKEHPLEWAMTQHNLAAALQNQGIRTNGTKGAELLAQAVIAYRAALLVRTYDAHPVEWAMTQNNLGVALKNQGIRTDGSEGAKLLAQAVTAYSAALEVRTRDAHPVQWAITHENIAISELSRADHDSCNKPQEALQSALKAVDAALTVYDPVHMSFNQAKATRLRDQILARLNS